MISSVILLVAISPFASAQAPSGIKKFEGMWSNPPVTIVGQMCAAWCLDVGIDRINALLDDAANDSRSINELQTVAANTQRDYIRSRLTDAALKNFPLDPADDPSFLRCEPYGFLRQILSRHQLEIRQVAKDRIDFHYGEWDVHRTIYLDGRKRLPNKPLTRMGLSVGHWEGETLVVETTGIRASITPWQSEHSDALHVTERYTRAADGKSLTVAATVEDPWSLRQPVVLKHIWGWAPAQTIAAYDQCEIPKEFKKRGTN
jgi:hypothetical protein